MTSTGSDESDRQRFDPRERAAAFKERFAVVRRQRERPLTPRQARRIRIAVTAVIMAGVAAALVVRLSDEPSVLTVGVYGAALTVCGVVIELSRRGRTRLAMWLLAPGIVAVAVAEQLLRAG